MRGAYNAISMLSPEKRAKGIVAFSSGNHAQGVALSCKLLGIPCTIVMPKDSATMKMEATRGYGATIIEYCRYTEDREQIANQLIGEKGLTLIPPFDHKDIVAG